MKNKCKKTILSLVILCGTLNIVSCGPQIEVYPWQIYEKGSGEKIDHKMNLEDVSTTTLEGEMLSAMPLALNYNTHKYQYQRANSIDMFAGYFTVSNSDFQYGGPLPYAYYYPNNYITGSLGESLKLNNLLYHAYFYGNNEKHKRPEWKAIAEIIYVYSMHELVDFFGTMPYDDYRALKETSPLTYIPGKICYQKMLTDLEEAIAILKERKPSATDLQKIEGEKGGYSNLKWVKWVKFANSLRLRLAINMVKAEPAWAQEVAEAAVNDEIGVLTIADNDFSLPNDGKTSHPIYNICTMWNDSRLGSSLENILKSYNSPLLEKWFAPNSAAIKTKSGGILMLSAKKEYVGIRQGVPMYPNSGSTSGYGAFSTFIDRYMPRTYFKVTEVLFAKAEGALRGWNMGGATAEELYTKGIQLSFNENQVAGFEDYINMEQPKKVRYEDYYAPEWGLDSRINIGVKWDKTDDNEVKLEKIITQKYIANFPIGAEAWTTFRRTGYPRLFPVPEKYKWSYDNSFDVELQIRRLPFGETTATDKANAREAEIALGAPNTAGTRVWWDIPNEKRVNNDPKGMIIPTNF